MTQNKTMFFLRYKPFPKMRGSNIREVEVENIGRGVIIGGLEILRKV